MIIWDSWCDGLLICVLLGCASAQTIIATVGTDVTLTCNYDARYHGKLSVCWGRGAIPNRGCANEVLKSDGTSVTGRLSERYLLLGAVGAGDVSLTIRQVAESDSGLYGCRVDVPGWFNDLKQQVTLSVTAARPNPVKIETREVKERTITLRWTPGFDGGRPVVAFILDLKNKQASWDTAVRTEIYDPELTQFTLVDLRPAKTYNLRMFVANNVGTSESSNVITVTTKEAAPEGPPLDMKLEGISPHSIRVTWKPPRVDLRNGVLRSYSISYREYDPAGRHFRHWQHVSVPPTRELESVVLDNLKPSTKYGVLVQAKTSAGIGPASTAPLCSTLDETRETTTASSLSSSTIGTVWIREKTSTAVSASTADFVPEATVWEQSTESSISGEAPDPPVVELKEVKDNTVSLFWTPGFEGDSPITSYCLEYKAVNASWDYTKSVVDFGPNQTEATIIEINPSTYNIRMFAKNSGGTSKASNVLTITTGEPGHQRDNFTTISNDTQAVSVNSQPRPTLMESAVSAEEGPGGHLAAIAVPVVLVMLTVATVTVWHLRRIRRRKGSVNMWLTNGALRFSGAESLQEL